MKRRRKLNKGISSKKIKMTKKEQLELKKISESLEKLRKEIPFEKEVNKFIKLTS